MTDGHGPSRCDICSEVWLRCRCPGPHAEKIETCPECKVGKLVAGTRPNIINRRRILQTQQREIEGQRMRLVTEFEILRRDCTHPKKRTYSAMGDLGEICDDCGWQT